MHAVLVRFATGGSAAPGTHLVRYGSKAEKLKTSTSRPLYPRKRTSDLRVLMSTRPSVMGPGDVKPPRVIVTPPSSRFCPWLAPRPPHYAVRRNGEPI